MGRNAMIRSLFFASFGFALIAATAPVNADSRAAETETLIDRFNRHLSMIQIIPVDSPTLVEGDGSVYEFVLKEDSSSPIFLFPDSEFIIDYSRVTYLPGEQGPNLPLCQALEYIEYADEISDEFLAGVNDVVDKISVSYRLLKLSADLGDNWFTALAELTFTMTYFATIDESRLLIRGYADRTSTDWTRPLAEELYDASATGYYSRIPVLEEEVVSAIGPTERFGLPLVVRDIPENYANEHLPNLRARYVEMLTWLQVEACIEDPYSQQSMILDGAVIDDVDDPRAQSARVFVYVRD